MTHPTDPHLVFETKYQPPQSSDKREFAYSLGNPPLPEKHSITAVIWKGVDVTELFYRHAPDIFEKWEDAING